MLLVGWTVADQCCLYFIWGCGCRDGRRRGAPAMPSRVAEPTGQERPDSFGDLPGTGHLRPIAGLRVTPAVYPTTCHTPHCRTATTWRGPRASTPPPPSGQMGRLARGPQGGRRDSVLSSLVLEPETPSEPTEPTTPPAAPACTPHMQPPMRSWTGPGPHILGWGSGSQSSNVHLLCAKRAPPPGEPPSCFGGGD